MYKVLELLDMCETELYNLITNKLAYRTKFNKRKRKSTTLVRVDMTFKGVASGFN